MSDAARPSLPTLPPHIARLPRDSRGFPVPWFVQWFDDDNKPCESGTGRPDFRVANQARIGIAVGGRRCWTCGGVVGAYKAFVIGPMCAINRVISEPPSHRDCAIFSARACPFLSKPRMRRNEKDIPSGLDEAAGMGLKRNPGAVCVWVTKSFKVFQAQAGNPGILFSLGNPEELLWFAEGRRAYRAEVMASIESGYPLLEEMARAEGAAALAALETKRKIALKLVPED